MKRSPHAVDAVIGELRSRRNPRNVEGMARYGINTRGTLGVSMPLLRAIGKRIGKDHSLALALWRSGIHEARILASLVDDPARVTDRQMDAWAGQFDSWDVCDQACQNLFEDVPSAYDKAVEWSRSEKDFVKRAGFVLMARLAASDRHAPDEKFRRLLPVIVRASVDERNFVRKAVNWALRQIGKRSPALHAAAVRSSRTLARSSSRSARWIGRDALRELELPTVRDRVKRNSLRFRRSAS
jgi:3-methyladenine DNA glycosylase AlkD